MNIHNYPEWTGGGYPKNIFHWGQISVKIISAEGFSRGISHEGNLQEEFSERISFLGGGVF